MPKAAKKLPNKDTHRVVERQQERQERLSNAHKEDAKESEGNMIYKYFIQVVHKRRSLINCQYELIMLSSPYLLAGTAPQHDFGTCSPFLVFVHDFLLVHSLRAKDMTINISPITAITYCCHRRHTQRKCHMHHYIQMRLLRFHFNKKIFVF